MNTELVRIMLARQDIPAISLARQIGVSHTTLSLWMNSHYEVPKRYRKTIAKALGVSVKQLFGGRSTRFIVSATTQGAVMTKNIKAKGPLVKNRLGSQ